jgi:hypothetical protein
MSNQYPGGFISKTPPTVTAISAQGMWTLSQLAQYNKAGVWPVYVPVAPDAPTIGTVTISYTTATVPFTAPLNNGGANITSYTATSSPGNLTGALNQAGDGSITVSGLTGSQAYTFTVKATNSAGSSAASSASNSVTATDISVPVVGQAYGGGFYAGKIAVGGGGVATHYLIVAPKASGENSSRAWGTAGASTGQFGTGTAVLITGPTNTTSLVALGASYEAAVFCNNLNSGAGLNGYKDWYLPAKNELEVLAYFLKPTTRANITSSPTSGSNANAVSPEPISTIYTSSSPAQTSAIGFRSGGTDAFNTVEYYWSSSEYGDNGAYNSGQYAWAQHFDHMVQDWPGKGAALYVRAVRRMAV